MLDWLDTGRWRPALMRVAAKGFGGGRGLGRPGCILAGRPGRSAQASLYNQNIPRSVRGRTKSAGRSAGGLMCDGRGPGSRRARQPALWRAGNGSGWGSDGPMPASPVLVMALRFRGTGAPQWRRGKSAPPPTYRHCATPPDPHRINHSGPDTLHWLALCSNTFNILYLLISPLCLSTTCVV